MCNSPSPNTRREFHAQRLLSIHWTTHVKPEMMANYGIFLLAACVIDALLGSGSAEACRVAGEGCASHITCCGGLDCVMAAPPWGFCQAGGSSGWAPAPLPSPPGPATPEDGDPTDYGIWQDFWPAEMANNTLVILLQVSIFGSNGNIIRTDTARSG